MPSTRWFSGAIAVVSLAVLSLALSGCAPRIPAEEMGFTHPVWTNDGLYLVERPGPGALFLARPPLALERYNHVIVEALRKIDLQLPLGQGEHTILVDRPPRGSPMG